MDPGYGQNAILKKDIVIPIVKRKSNFTFKKQQILDDIFAEVHLNY